MNISPSPLFQPSHQSIHYRIRSDLFIQYTQPVNVTQPVSTYTFGSLFVVYRLKLSGWIFLEASRTCVSRRETRALLASRATRVSVVRAADSTRA